MKPSINTPQAGAYNLLVNCAGLQAGERVLIVGEAVDNPWFDPALCGVVAAMVKELKGIPRIVMVAHGESADVFPNEVAKAMREVEVTIFFSRLGDQVRFLKAPGNSRKVMCYTTTLGHLSSSFATVDYKAMRRMHDHLVASFAEHSHYTLTTREGSHLTAVNSEKDSPTLARFSEFTLALFPIVIFPPINFDQLEGQLVLTRFLTSTSTREYADSVLHLDSAVVVEVANCRMVEFQGDTRTIEAVKRQLERAAAITGGDPYRINSWHAGINPHTYFEGDPYQDMERWGTETFGSPRFTHLHACGHDPGDISINLFDASIYLEGQPFWQDGRFVYLDRPDVEALFSAVDQAPTSSNFHSIGISSSLCNGYKTSTKSQLSETSK